MIVTAGARFGVGAGPAPVGAAGAWLVAAGPEAPAPSVAGAAGADAPACAEAGAAGAEAAAGGASEVIVITRCPPIVTCTVCGSLAPALGFSMRTTGSRGRARSDDRSCELAGCSTVSVMRQLNGGSDCSTLASTSSSTDSSRNFFQLMPTSQFA